ncbi:hypothetical protein ACFPPF_01000 [Xenophilus aerolatus]|nr:hypothetical protein [Xenophilus aerolatus]
MDKLGIAWGMNPKSSQALQTAAALKAFGLVDYTGTSKERGVALSEDGRNYLRAQQDSIKTEILKRCAVKPRAIALCWNRWGADRPPDEVCLDELILKNKFTDPAARTLLRVYDDTVAFAKLQGSDSVAVAAGLLGEHDEGDDEPAAGGVDRPASGPNVGDFVRWESAGVVMFDARRVLGRSPDGEYVFVEGSRTGLPLKEIAMVEAPAAPSSSPPLSPFASTSVAAESSAVPGEREWLRGPLSKEASYRLIVSGNLGSKELGKLIKLLEAQRLVLDDE